MHREKPEASKNIRRGSGRREGVDIALRLRMRPAQEATILRQIERGGHNLVVLGVKVRAGEWISLGQSVVVLRERIPCSVLLIAF